MNAPQPARPKPAFIEDAEREAIACNAGVGLFHTHVKTVSLGELDTLIGRQATDALVKACGGFRLPVPSPGQKREVEKVIIDLIGHARMAM